MNPAGSSPQLAGINLWSSAPADVAGLLGAVLGVELSAREAEDGQHFSGRADGLMVSVHPSEEPATELAFLVDEIEPVISACAERGSQVISGPEQLPYGVSAHLRGPGDTRVELVQFQKSES